MTQEENLLFRDLCARLPYGVKCELSGDGAKLVDVLQLGGLGQFMLGRIEVKPYLRPMSFMTEEEIDTLWNIWENDAASEAASKMTDFLNKKYLDHHHLIEKGLALEAPEGMYNIK